MREKASHEVMLYVDERTEEGQEVIRLLMDNQILFSTIPTSGRVPTLVVGVTKREGIDDIKIFVENILSQKREKCLSSEDPFGLKKVVLGGDEPILENEVDFVRRKREKEKKDK